MSPEDIKLASLIDRVSRGDRAAFKALYDATAPKLFGVILRIAKEPAIAEEVLQEAYLRIWQNASSFSPEAGRPMTWLIAVARYRTIDVIRQRTEIHVAPDQDGEDWLARLAEPGDHEADFLSRNALSICLSRIAEEQRRCLLLAYYEGYSREELAQRFDRPVNTIKTWLHRSLASLRACLDETP